MSRIPCLVAVVMLAVVFVSYQEDAVNVWYEFVAPGTWRTMSPPRADLAEFMARQESRDAVGREVLAGRLSLVEAAAECHRINGSRSTEIVRWCPGKSLEERLCRQVIHGVQSLESMDGLPATVSDRLAVELEGRRSSGTLIGAVVW
jgi:hypothetical protein